MNERIRELALQAGVDFFHSTDPEYCGREYCEAWTEQQQKFAELIIRECLSYAKDGDIDFMKFMIEKHFGVEE